MVQQEPAGIWAIYCQLKSYSKQKSLGDLQYLEENHDIALTWILGQTSVNQKIQWCSFKQYQFEKSMFFSFLQKEEGNCIDLDSSSIKKIVH